jgi:hypothetical protein
LATLEVSSLVRLTKPPERYLESREVRREQAYEAMLASGRETWSAGDKVRVYRKRMGAGGVVDEEGEDPRDYDVEHYGRVLRESFAVRLARAFTAEDYATVFADPGQMTLFAPPMEGIQTVLTRQPGLG